MALNMFVCGVPLPNDNGVQGLESLSLFFSCDITNNNSIKNPKKTKQNKKTENRCVYQLRFKVRTSELIVVH